MSGARPQPGAHGRRSLLRSLSAVPFLGAATAANARGIAPDAADPASALDGIVAVTDAEPLARERLSHMAYEYVAGAAADGNTLRWNREAYDRIRLRPKVLIDVSELDLRTTVLGQELPFPILLAPTAYHRVYHPDGEIGTARAASSQGAAMVLSSFANTAVEDVAHATTAPLWFQLYAQRDRGFTKDLVQRAEAAGCRALCITVDTPVGGARDREKRVHFALPDGLDLPNLRGLKNPASSHRPKGHDIFSAILDPTLTWKEVAWLRSVARTPVLLKGILNPDDADRAAKEGMAGIIVSNHGARNLDTVPATIEALPTVVDKVAGRLAVLVDGGVRRGTDVVKALALGASAVLVGRPYVYGLTVAGAAGVEHILRILREETAMAMALTGRRSLREIDRTVLWDR